MQIYAIIIFYKPFESSHLLVLACNGGIFRVGGEGLRYGRKDGWRYGWIGGQREKVREVYGFSSLVKQNKKGKNCAVFCFAGKRKLLYLYLRCDYIGNFS
jgi:hypothetical protein